MLSGANSDFFLPTKETLLSDKEEIICFKIQTSVCVCVYRYSPGLLFDTNPLLSLNAKCKLKLGGEK